ncbi:hypothetical protein OG874_11455 [Nocardia sp. NBC_00565]|uniref:hypothetical protein n=1 Tax=Nocardia sp. NBC_00565 TaxID=2975993 RepID=UPI002E81DBDB|nr:hypothetical protein [Nocardia sp. NBC_00565]WUC05710.1 hypothetical protein OG874_11455 [Nocardia sp. NBC_00565]
MGTVISPMLDRISSPRIESGGGAPGPETRNHEQYRGSAADQRLGGQQADQHRRYAHQRDGQRYRETPPTIAQIYEDQSADGVDESLISEVPVRA